MKPDCSLTAKHLPHPQPAEQGCGVKKTQLDKDNFDFGSKWEEGSALLNPRGEEFQR